MSLSPEVYAFLLELICHIYHLLSSISWSTDVTWVLVMVAIMILVEDVAHLEVIVVPILVDRLLAIRSLGNVSIAGETIISLRSAGRNLVALNGPAG